MNDHPLSPRKQYLWPNVTGILVSLFIAMAAFGAPFVLAPPQAWSKSTDTAVALDVSSFTTLLFYLLPPFSGNTNRLLAELAALISVPERALSLFTELDIAGSLAVRVAAAVLAGTFVGAGVRNAMLRRSMARPAVQHIAGLQLLDGKAGMRSLAAEWQRRYGDSSGVALVEGLHMPRQLEAEHILITGGTGAGKTSILQTILGSALQLGDRVLILDVKGEMTARIPSDDIAVLALDGEEAARWDIGKDIRTRQDADELAIELIPETSDPAWSAGARQVLSAIIQTLQRQAAKTGSSWSWQTLDRVLAKPVADIHRGLKTSHPVEASFIDVTSETTLRQAMSFYLVMIASAGLIVRACAGAGADGKGSRSISIREWVAGNANQVFVLRQSQQQPELSAIVVRLTLKIVADAAVSQASERGPYPTWLVLDEMPQIGECSTIPRLAAIGRSAGIRLIGVVQSPAQLAEIYGAEAADTLLANFSTKIVGRMPPGSTALEISSTWIGKRKVLWSEPAGRDANGSIRVENKTEDIPIADASVLSNELGFHGAFGRAGVYALVVGHGDVARLWWPVGLWPTRRGTPEKVPE